MTDLPAGLRIFIGVVEILGAIGAIVPPLVNVLPILAPIAAAGLAIVMVLAAVYHIPRRENPNIVLNLVLVALAVFVAYGRFVLLPF
ncbi:MAG TPA: DoxX family protein [Roseiflexaceae bacterium]|nr:DoxX family protein [Roseiflexaceae bacterium]